MTDITIPQFLVHFSLSSLASILIKRCIRAALIIMSTQHQRRVDRALILAEDGSGGDDACDSGRRGRECDSG